MDKSTRYRRHVIRESEVVKYAPTGGALFSVAGKHVNKEAGTRPFLQTVAEAKDFIDGLVGRAKDARAD